MFAKFILYTLSVACIAAVASQANAEIKPYTAPLTKDNPAFKQVYLVNGKETGAQEALMAAIKGEQAFRCTSIEAGLNKNGTGITLKNTKRKVNQ